MRYVDRVMEASQTQGTGAITLAGPVTGYRSFASALQTGDEVTYCIDAGASWEICRGIFTAPATLSRGALQSSSTGSRVGIAGPSRVFVTQAASAVMDRAEALEVIAANPGPPGAKGDKGDKGDQGDRGDDGASSFGAIRDLLAAATTAVGFNSQRLTGLAVGTGIADAVALGQLRDREGARNVRDYGARGYSSTFTVDASTNVITTATAHEMSIGQRVNMESTSALPTIPALGGTERTTPYYVIAAPTPTTLKLSTSEGGAEVDFSNAGSGTHTLFADDSAAFAAALSAAQAQGGHIFVPPGRYTIGANVGLFNGANAAAHLLLRGSGSASVIRFHFTGLSSMVFQFANVDGIVCIEDIVFMGSGGPNDHDANVCFLFQSNGRSIIQRCSFYSLRGAASSPILGAVIQHNADLTIRDSTIVECNGDTAVIVSDRPRNLELINVKCVDVGQISWPLISKTRAEGPWYRAIDANPIAYGSSDASCIRAVNVRFDEAPMILFRIDAPPEGRRYSSVLLEQVHCLLPRGGCAIDASAVEHVRVIDCDIGYGGNIVTDADAQLAFRGCRMVEIDNTHAGPRPGHYAAPNILTSSTTQVLRVRGCDNWVTNGVHPSTLLVRDDVRSDRPTITGNLSSGDVAALRGIVGQLIARLEARGELINGTT
jgi:hypothetical protein